MKTPLTASRIKFETDLAYEVEVLFDCDTSDAQGLIEANDELVTQLFDDGFTPLDAANAMYNSPIDGVN